MLYGRYHGQILGLAIGLRQMGLESKLREILAEFGKRLPQILPPATAYSAVSWDANRAGAVALCRSRQRGSYHRARI
jgi:hypothetical protein